MQPVIYDVAVSIDGFIAGPDADITRFSQQGPVVDDYNARLATYSCAVMGRHTYEFGYGFGLEPGRNPYPHMRTIVFSETIEIPDHGEVDIARGDVHSVLREVRETQSAPIYLCGGGQFAGSVLALGLIDVIRLKRAPIVLGDGTPLFAGVPLDGETICTDLKSYENGYLFQEFKLLH